MNKSDGYKFCFFIAFFLFLNAGNLLAQVNPIPFETDTTKLPNDTLIHLKDVSDYFKDITKLSLRPQKDTAKIGSLGPFFTPFLYPGYAEVTSYLVGLAGNISFYTHRAEDAKISSILLNNLFSVDHQFISIINSNIYTDKENLNLVGDWRFYKFPTNTFGLGSETTLSDKTSVDYSQIRVYEVAMMKVFQDFNAGIGYNLDHHWNIIEYHQDTVETQTPTDKLTDMDKYGFNSTSTSSGVSLNAEYDSRLNSNDPLRGTYANIQIRDNLTILGSDNNWQSLLLDARHYIKVSKNSNNVLALWTYDWLTLSGKPPYFDLPTIGFDAYNNTGRPYVQGRFKGLNMVYAEAEYRFRIMKNGFLGGVLFSNAASFTEWPSNKFEKIIPGNGVGLRIKMNKRSDSNLCVDYGFGTDGSHGFVFNLNEVF